VVTKNGKNDQPIREKVKQANKKRSKHIPQRTCVGCREVLAKRAMMRVVRTPDGVELDASGKKNGRGAYVHDKRSCWERALKGSLAHALKTELSEKDRLMLREMMKTLPKEDSGEKEPEQNPQ
jgi:predicted RNA-binding protein YlxR (DUF448 family)